MRGPCKLQRHGMIAKPRGLDQVRQFGLGMVMEGAT